MVKIFKVGIGLFAVIFLASCATTQSLSNAIHDFEVQSRNIQLGQTKAEVLALLTPTQAELPARFAKPHEQFMEDNKLTEIYFFR